MNPDSKYTNPTTATAVCDYDFNETELTDNGWTQAFDEEFNGDLSNWGSINGGMIKELQLYSPANTQIVNGSLQITAKKVTVSGPETVGSNTTKSFNYSSGWVVSKATIAANNYTPKIRIVARIKMTS